LNNITIYIIVTTIIPSLTLEINFLLNGHACWRFYFKQNNSNIIFSFIKKSDFNLIN